MSVAGRLAVVAVLSLELLGTRAARADAGAGATGGLCEAGEARAAEELSYVWPTH